MDSIKGMETRDKIKSTCREIRREILDISRYLHNNNTANTFHQLMEYISGKVEISCNGQLCRFDDGRQAIKPLTVFYITNRPEVALIAEKYGVDRVWIDLETLGKEERQRGMNTVKNHHTVADITMIKPLLTKAEMMVRVNPWYEGSKEEIENVIAANADIIMLPYWKTVDEVRRFVETVDGRCKTTLLLETSEAIECIDEVIEIGGFNEIHIGLNDLHLSFGMTFMFELLVDGTVEMLCKKFKSAGIPYGFGGIAKLGDGLLPAEKIIMEHYRLGSTRAILSRTFCDNVKIENIEEIDEIFKKNMEVLREYELSMADVTQEEYEQNKVEVARAVNEIVATIKSNKV